jgi:hypothetical protein
VKIYELTWVKKKNLRINISENTLMNY